jgi:hypothetical protein
VALIPRRPFRRRRDGTYEVNLDPAERELVQVLLDRLRDLLLADDPVLRRLFPVVHTDDPEREAAYQELAKGQLLESRFVAIETVEETLGAETLDEAQLDAWMQAINALRLVIGTLLDVTEDGLDLEPDDPRADPYLLYEQLGRLLALIVWSLSQSLPDPAPGPAFAEDDDLDEDDEDDSVDDAAGD